MNQNSVNDEVNAAHRVVNLIGVTIGIQRIRGYFPIERARSHRNFCYASCLMADIEDSADLLEIVSIGRRVGPVYRTPNNRVIGPVATSVRMLPR